LFENNLSRKQNPRNDRKLHQGHFVLVSILSLIRSAEHLFNETRITELFHRDSSPAQDARASRNEIVRVIARLNVGGPAKHVVWLSKCNSELGVGSWSRHSPAGEDDMLFRNRTGRYSDLCSRDESRNFRKRRTHSLETLHFSRRERPDIVHTHTAISPELLAELPVLLSLA